MSDQIKIDHKTLASRLFLGSARYPNFQAIRDAVTASQCDVLTVSLRREASGTKAGNKFWDYIRDLDVHILPNTAGCTKVKEAVTTAHMARELFETNWIKLEVIGNEDTLQPDPFQTVEAARILCQEGFEVFPYTTEDLIVAEKLVEAGCDILMPWGAPIGTGQGIRHPEAIQAIRHYFPEITLVVDAGIGSPSHACYAMELGCDAVLVNTAIAQAQNPAAMAGAFAQAVTAGREGYLSGLMTASGTATASTPILGQPFWHQLQEF